MNNAILALRLVEVGAAILILSLLFSAVFLYDSEIWVFWKTKLGEMVARSGYRSCGCGLALVGIVFAILLIGIGITVRFL